MSSMLAIASAAALAALGLARTGSRSRPRPAPPKPTVAGAEPQDAVSARKAMMDLMRSFRSGRKGVAADYLNEYPGFLLDFYRKWLDAGSVSWPHRTWYLRDLQDAPDDTEERIKQLEEADEHPYELIEEFLSSDPSVISAFNDYAMSKAGEEFQPPFTVFSNPKLIKDVWLIHHSPASHLDEDGFRFGVSDLAGLAYTGGARTFQGQRPGYGFAYLPEHHEHYGFGGRRSEPKYGDHIYAFWVPYAISAYHNNDGEPQVIFWGPSARNIVEIERTEVSTEDGPEDRWIVAALGPRTIAAESSDDLVAWLRDHWRQAKAYTQWVDVSRRRVERGWSAEVVGKKTVKDYYGDEREVDVQADVFRGPGKGTSRLPRR